MDSAEFYSNIEAFSDFADITHQDKFWALPDDWSVVVADITNSSEAVSKGEMKAVNIIGVSVITAIRNAVATIEIPYIFGGDGAALCVPNSFLAETERALLATHEMARQQFRLDLRVGIVSSQQIRNAGKEVFIGKHQLSQHYAQAAFAGGGIEYAEEAIKMGQLKCLESVASISTQDANYEGLECRWNKVPSQHGETIAVIIKASGDSDQENTTIYQEILGKLNTLYGRDENCRPVHSSGLRMTYNKDLLSHEVRVRTAGLTQEKTNNYYRELVKTNLLGWFLMLFKINAANIKWGEYKTDLVTNTDFKKFDGTLRQVISGNSQQRNELEQYLNALFADGKCYYGIHVSNAALVTCMIDNRAGEHYHFVDGADGGYTLAAESMKKQIFEKNRHSDQQSQ